jgi:hypothetical protein
MKMRSSANVRFTDTRIRVGSSAGLPTGFGAAAVGRTLGGTGVEACGEEAEGGTREAETRGALDGGAEIRDVIGAGTEGRAAIGEGTDEAHGGTGGGPDRRAPDGPGGDQPAGLGAGGWIELFGAGELLELASSAAARANVTTRRSRPSRSASSAARRNQRAASPRSPRASRASAVSSATVTASESDASAFGEIVACMKVSFLTCATMESSATGSRAAPVVGAEQKHCQRVRRAQIPDDAQRFTETAR